MYQYFPTPSLDTSVPFFNYSAACFDHLFYPLSPSIHDLTLRFTFNPRVPRLNFNFIIEFVTNTAAPENRALSFHFSLPNLEKLLAILLVCQNKNIITMITYTSLNSTFTKKKSLLLWQEWFCPIYLFLLQHRLVYFSKKKKKKIREQISSVKSLDMHSTSEHGASINTRLSLKSPCSSFVFP